MTKDFSKFWIKRIFKVFNLIGVAVAKIPHNNHIETKS